MEKYFFFDESPVYTNKYIIRLNHEKFPFPNGTKGSFNVIVARLLNLNYADYLRYARDVLGAELIGKGTRYVMPYFDKNEVTDIFIRLLNKRMEYVMLERRFPYDYVEGEDGKIERIPFKDYEYNYETAGTL